LKQKGLYPIEALTPCPNQPRSLVGYEKIVQDWLPKWNAEMWEQFSCHDAAVLLPPKSVKLYQSMFIPRPHTDTKNCCRIYSTLGPESKVRFY
jgi:hypothetical protein